MVRKGDRIGRGAFPGADPGEIGCVIIEKIGEILHGEAKGLQKLVQMFGQQGRFVSDDRAVAEQTLFAERRNSGFGLQLCKSAAQLLQHLAVRSGNPLAAAVAGDHSARKTGSA